MSWQDRLGPAQYTSPSGVTTTFEYENVRIEADKKTADFDFVDADGTFIQDSGTRGRRYPLRMFISGDNYDIEADRFLDSLLETGPGVLDHPRYGRQNVVPFGKISQRDDLKTAANQAILDVLFWSTIGTTRPTSADNPADSIVNKVDQFNLVQASSFDEQLFVGTVSLQTNVESVYSRIKGQVTDGLQAIANAQDDTRNLFDTVSKSIDQGLNILVGEPLTLARQTQVLIDTPARALTSIAARLDAYQNLARSIVQSATGSQADPNAPTIAGLNPIPGNPASEPPVVGIPDIPIIPADPALASDDALEASNKFQVEDLNVSSLLIGMVLSSINTELSEDVPVVQTATIQEAAALTSSADSGSGGFVTRSDAIQAADQLLTQFQTVSAWRDGNFQALQQIDQGPVYQALQEAVALAAGYLVELSFSLKQERSLILDRERTPLDLVAELYGETDSKLDFLITSNDLTGDEIFAIPRGREIVYYI